MNILLIGSGGREHALAIKLKQSPKLKRLFIAPGNPGTAEVGTNVPISDTNIDALLQFAKTEKVDLTIVGPEAPLTQGIVDKFRAEGLRIIGPDKSGARLEGSKKWAKELMLKSNIPTARYASFTDYEAASEYIQKQNRYPVVIKADGLAAGKGVTIAQHRAEAEEALGECFLKNKFGEAGKIVVIEEFLSGEEASILAFCDGETIVPMPPAQDHKTIFDGDKGPNTGGMGAYCPAPVVSQAIRDEVFRTIFTPLLAGLKKENIVYKGVIYAGLMICDRKPYVIEFNARFGDPETQVVLPLLETDLLEVFLAIDNAELKNLNVKWSEDSAVCVVLASKGYPGDYEKNKLVSGLEDAAKTAHAQVIHAGTKTDPFGKVLTSGGRVLGVVARRDSLDKAIQSAYEALAKIRFEGKTFRTDIGAKALAKQRS